MESGLKRKGFVPSDGKHPVVTYATEDGKKTSVRTHFSHSDRKMDRYRLRQMAQQVGLTVDQFVDLIDCPMTRETFERVLAGQGKLPR